MGQDGEEAVRRIYIWLNTSLSIRQSRGGEGTRCKYPTRLDTYGCGCEHNCSYCYARSLLEFRKLWNPEEPRVADIGRIKRRLDRIEKGTIIRMGGMTDCFQSCEREQRITLQTIEAMNERGIGYLLVTKSDLVAEDEYLKAMDKDLAHIQVSVTSTDPEISRRYENAPLPEQRIAAIEKLQKEGFDVALRLSPFIPEFVDMAVINAVEVDKILVEFLRVNGNIKKCFDIDYSPYSVSYGNYFHLPLERKLEALKMVDRNRHSLSVCEDHDEHYEYWKNNLNANSEDCCNLRKRKEI